MNRWLRKKYLHLFSALALSFGVLSPLPASASVVESCVGNDCTVTFTFSGEMNTFNPPKNAKNLTFELLGAQGGRSGGGGGKVTGSLTEIPEVLYIFVGGAGLSGNNSPGGFNGGGAGGSGSNSEGSGGGATDIRTGLELSSRIVVAGGGGARGAGTGSGGGLGGGLIALSGRTAQGFGGAGGSQEAAGVGGAPNGSGTAGLEGSFGVGGAGGSSSLFGGGGGGGGYFGGGGGGSDSDPCCSDAGGGGGGSSYTDANLVSNVVHTQGTRLGSGQVVLAYQLAPEVLSISSQTLGNQLSFQIEFGETVSGFEISDLEINHSEGSCVSSQLSGSGQSYQLLLTDCEDGQVWIAVKPDAVLSFEVSGPITSFSSSTVIIDTVAPSATWSQASSVGSNLEFTEPITALDLSAIEISSNSETCSLLSVSQQDATTWLVSTTGCEQSNFTLSLQALSVSDASGNLGPQSAASTSFQAEVPEQEPVEEIASTPSETVSREEPDEPSKQQPTLPDAPAVDTDQPDELPVSNPGFQDQVVSAPKTYQPADLPEEDLSQELSAPGIFTAPPPNSLPQASQTLTIPAQSGRPGVGSYGLTFGLIALGLFALVAGLVIARRGIPGVLSS